MANDPVATAGDPRFQLTPTGIATSRDTAPRSTMKARSAKGRSRISVVLRPRAQVGEVEAVILHSHRPDGLARTARHPR